jgi:crossover junction endodeoxyribonuclease RuvC
LLAFEKIILGIDPGTSLMGYGIIGVNGKNATLITMGIVSLNKIEGHDQKLKKIFEQTLQLIDEFKPQMLAIEAPFFGKNVQSMLKLGRAQGVSIAAAMHRDVPIEEYQPRKIKQSITGNGSASKEQVAKMLQTLLKIESLPKNLDATDGLAAAMCAFFQRNTNSKDKSYGSWDSFVKQNPKRKI